MRMRFSVCSTRCSPRLRDRSRSPRVDRGLDGPATRSVIVRRWSVAFSECSTLPWPRPRTGIQVCFFSMPVWPSPLLASSSGSNRIPGGDLDVPVWAWVATIGAIAVMVTIDLLVLRRQDREVTLRGAAVGTAVWVSIGLAFAVVVWATLGGSATGQYLTGYVIEESLSVDNVFVWAFIFAGVALLDRFSWIEIIFGAFLVITAWRIAFHDETQVDPEHNPLFRLARRILPVTAGYRGHHMFVRESDKRYATPLFLVLVFVELTDVVFAVDSVPAVLAVSRSQFIVFTSNAFAILGLRAIYFLLAGAKDALVHLN